MRLVWGIVTSVEHASADIQVLEVALDDRTVGPAIAFPGLVGECAVAQRVLVNTTASSLESSSGVRAVVLARLGPTEGVAYEGGDGRTLKLRHTPVQTSVRCVEERDGVHHETMRHAADLAGMPVACCGSPGQVFAVAVAAKAVAPHLRVAHCMSDDGALTIAVSDAVRAARASGVLDATITCGQAIGGDLEALNLYSGLIAARHIAKADIAIVAPGPGVPGTATWFGHAGTSQGVAVNAVSALSGVPVAVLRLSAPEGEDDHVTVHPQTVVSLTRVALARAVVPVPPLPEDLAEDLSAAIDASGILTRHARVDVVAVPETAVTAVRNPRGRAEDSAAAAAAAAAGVVCARYAVGVPDMPDVGGGLA